jgi:hypothetical protein
MYRSVTDRTRRRNPRSRSRTAPIRSYLRTYSFDAVPYRYIRRTYTPLTHLQHQSLKRHARPDPPRRHHPGLLGLPEDPGQPNPRDRVGGQLVAQHLPRADRRQLVDITDQQHMRTRRNGLDQLVGQTQIKHGRLIDHNQVGVDRMIPVKGRVWTAQPNGTLLNLPQASASRTRAAAAGVPSRTAPQPTNSSTYRSRLSRPPALRGDGCTGWRGEAQQNRASRSMNTARPAC